MKTLIRLSILALGLATVSVPALSAAAAKAERGGDRPLLRAQLARRAALKGQVARRLDLTEEQKTQLKATREQNRTALQALRNDTTLTREQKKEKAKEILQSARTEMRSKLNGGETAAAC